MSDFTPNGILYILKNVPLDPDYEKTLYFDDEQTQYDYFKSKRDTTLSWENRQYQKVGKGTLRVKALADKLYDCNYLMFQNRKYGSGNKWFYAFIREVRYINDDTSEIIYTLDVMQTWLFQYKDNIEECYVEREHTVSDELYEHVVPEDNWNITTRLCNEYDKFNIAGLTNALWNIAIITSDLWDSNMIINDAGETVKIKVSPKDNYNLGSITANYCGIRSTYPVSSYKNTGFPFPPFKICNIETPLYVYTFAFAQISQSFHLEDIIDVQRGSTYAKYKIDSSLNNFLNTVNKESIVYAYYYPSDLGSKLSELSSPYESTKTPLTNNNTLTFAGIHGDAYTPKNKKLYINPYSILQVTNNSGQTKEYNFELFGEGASFDFRATVLLNPELRITPKNYSKSSVPFLNEALLITELPELAFTVNAYQQYLINNGNRLATSLVSDSIMGLLSAGLGATGLVSPASATRQTIGSAISIADKLALLEDKRKQASSIVGTANSPSLNFALGEIRFEFRTMRINGEMAKIIDEYFTRYGYKCMEIKKPNLKARPYFTYTKTIQCEINASIPQDDLENIKSVFNMGTTFWYITEPTTGVFPQDEVIGKYLTVDNQPVTSTGG